MVKNDATFIVLNSGNLEVIAVRNRANQTLYLSDIIATTKPGYFQIHVGLCIAAIQDARDRAAQLKALEAADGLPLSWTGYASGRAEIHDEENGPGLDSIEQILSNCQRLSLVPSRGTSSTLSYRRQILYGVVPKNRAMT